MFHKLCWIQYQYRQFREGKLIKCPTCRTPLLFYNCKSNYHCSFKNNDNGDTTIIDVAATVTKKINDNSQSNTGDVNNLVLNNNDDAITATTTTDVTTTTATSVNNNKEKDDNNNVDNINETMLSNQNV